MATDLRTARLGTSHPNRPVFTSSLPIHEKSILQFNKSTAENEVEE
jgi:hypothetical protein